MRKASKYLPEGCVARGRKARSKSRSTCTLNVWCLQATLVRLVLVKPSEDVPDLIAPIYTLLWKNGIIANVNKGRF